MAHYLASSRPSIKLLIHCSNEYHKLYRTNENVKTTRQTNQKKMLKIKDFPNSIWYPDVFLH